jgi:hypothetical protein
MAGRQDGFEGHFQQGTGIQLRRLVALGADAAVDFARQHARRDVLDRAVGQVDFHLGVARTPRCDGLGQQGAGHQLGRRHPDDALSQLCVVGNVSKRTVEIVDHLAE